MELFDRMKRHERYDDMLAALMLVSMAVVVCGIVCLMVYGITWGSAATMEAMAGGLDVCTERDGTGGLTNRAFVEAGEPCPDPGEWRTVERTANADLVDPSGQAAMAAIGAAVLASGIAGAALAWRAHDAYEWSR